MNSGPARALFADQMRADGQKGRHRVIDFDDRQALFHFIAADAEMRADNRRRCRRAAQQLGEPIIFDECDVARPRLGDRSRRPYRDAAIADQATANQVPQVVPPLRPRTFSFLP